MEYPKALYMGGVGSSLVEMPYVVVNNQAEEDAKNLEGWFQIGKAPVKAPEPVAEPEQADEAAPEAPQAAEAPKRRGRPPKAAQ